MKLVLPILVAIGAVYVVNASMRGVAWSWYVFFHQISFEQGWDPTPWFE